MTKKYPIKFCCSINPFTLFLANERGFRMMLRILTVLISFMLFLCSPVTLSAENRGIKLHVERLALVIGNGAYQKVPLKNPINDAEDMAATLKKLGFKVILKKDADQRTMEDAIRYFGRQLRNGGVGLFYFAGHGVQVEGRNYLMPVDARIESESDVKYEAVDAGRVLGKMQDAENRLNIVILDACRNNPFARSFRSDKSGLARMDAPTGSIIAYSTAPGEVAADGTERNGIFTKYLIQHMMTPNLSIEHVLKLVRIDVAEQTNGRQIPWESSSLMGEFCFNPDKSITKIETRSRSKISPESTSKTQVAAINDDNKRNIEPWTGSWEVEGSRFYSGTWALKQNGSRVVSTKDSMYTIEGSVDGNAFKGNISSTNFRFELMISSDGMSFKGIATDYLGRENIPIKGSKISPETAPKTQVAAINDDNKRSIEPWTGSWEVEGSRFYSGTWALEQNGSRVVSTKDSINTIEGSVNGNSFKGNISSTNYRFELKLSSDGMSFKGIGTDYLGRSNIPIKGRRKE